MVLAVLCLVAGTPIGPVSEYKGELLRSLGVSQQRTLLIRETEGRDFRPKWQSRLELGPDRGCD